MSDKPKWKLWQKYTPPPEGEYYWRNPAYVGYFFAVVLFAIVFIPGWSTLVDLYAGKFSFESVLVVGLLILGILCLVEAIRGGYWEMVINATGIVWATPRNAPTTFLWNQLKAFDMQARPDSPCSYRLHLNDETIVEIPANCCGDEPSLQAALSLRIPCLGVFYRDGRVLSLEEVRRPFSERLNERFREGRKP